MAQWVWKLLTWAAGMVAAVAVIFAIVVGVRWLAAYQPEPQTDGQASSLEAQWNSTIRRLGVNIEPVYPPQEDLSVGDLFATVVKDDLQYPSAGQGKRVDTSTPFLGKSVKLGHVDVSKELESAYSEIPIFPETGAPRSDSATSFFGQRGQRQNLPRAAFPGLTIYHTGNASAGVAASSRGWFDFSAANEDSLKLILGVVETYGLDVVTASKALTKYCLADSTKDVCTEDTMRKHLRPLVDNVFEKFFDPFSNTQRYAVSVRLIMVNRLYLAREILEQRKIGVTEGGGAQVGPATTRPSADAPNTVEQRIATIEKQLGDLQNGGALIFRSASGTDILLDVKFPRPVAIGYRSVPYGEESPN